MVVTTIVTESQWRTEHGKNKDRLVVIDFFATWCGPCKQIAPFFDDLSNRYSKEAAFYRVDVDQSQSIAQANGVEAMPTFLFFVNEKKIETVKGADQRRLEQLVKDLSAKHTKNVFKTGAGYSLGGASNSASNARPASGASGAAGAGGARKNPWADPNFVAKKLNVPADKPATPAPAPAAASSSSSSSKAPSTPSTTAPAKAPSTPSTITPAKASAPTTPSTPSSTTTTPSSQRSEPKGLAALSASAIKEKSSAPPASAPVSTPSTTGNSSGTPVDPKLLNGLIDMGIERSHAERALRATTKVGLEGDHHLNAAMDWAFSHPAPTTPAASTPSTNNASSSASPSPATNAPSSASAAPSSSSSAPASAPAAASSSSSKADEMEMDDDEAVIFAAMKEKLSKEKESNVPMDAAYVQSRAEEREQKKLSEMSSEEKTQWLARRKLEVKAKREKEAIEREKDAEKSRRALHAAQSDLKERLEREAVEALAKQKRKEEMERKKVRNDLRDKLKADKERRIKEQADEIERVRKMKEAQAAAKK